MRRTSGWPIYDREIKAVIRFNVFKVVKRGEATNYRLTLKRVRRKARRRLTTIQQ
jgi:hypothetical protein